MHNTSGDSYKIIRRYLSSAVLFQPCTCVTIVLRTVSCSKNQSSTIPHFYVSSPILFILITSKLKKMKKNMFISFVPKSLPLRCLYWDKNGTYQVRVFFQFRPGGECGSVLYFSRVPLPLCPINPFRTAVPFWGQTTKILSSLSPKRDCGSKRVNRFVQQYVPGGDFYLV